jgi:transposase
MRRRAYGAVSVNDVDSVRLVEGRDGQAVRVGIDVGKFELRAVCRWADSHCERPWRLHNPGEIPELVRLLQRLGAARQLVVAMESTGTYGDALRQALADASVTVERISSKAAHDYAEVFDGVPSQHDGKDAALVAELSALGKGRPWPYQAKDLREQELKYWVEWLVTHRQILTMWQGRLEGLLARHWPEATATLKLGSVTLLQVLKEYGSPARLAADADAARRLRRWGGRHLAEAKVQALLAGARSSAGVRAGDWEIRQLRDYAAQALAARQQRQQAVRHLRELARGHAVLEAQGRVVGLPTACVLWVGTGDPRNFPAAGAYRKAMGLNLTERSSGVYQGQLRISKRGHSRSRQWLYFAALRLVQTSEVRRWYEAKKATGGSAAKKILVALMRKLALALYHVGVQGETFDAGRLLAGVVARSRPPAPGWSKARC